MPEYVAVIATFGHYVLIGRSGKWAMTDLEGPAHTEIVNAQRYPAPADTPAARNAAMDAFEEYAKDNKYNIGEIVWKPDGVTVPARYSTKFIRRTNPNPPGFIKGTVSPPSTDVTLLKQKAIEEFEEETGMKLTSADLNPTTKSNVFVVDMTTKVDRKQHVIHAWKELGRFTEIVELDWILRNEIPTMNSQSEENRHLIPLPLGGGRRRTLRSKSKAQTIRTKQWSSAKSSRSHSRH